MIKRSKEYYSMLGISENASHDEIKKAQRNFNKKHFSGEEVDDLKSYKEEKTFSDDSNNKKSEENRDNLIALKINEYLSSNYDSNSIEFEGKEDDLNHIKINEEFSDEDEKILKKIEKKEFDSLNSLNLKLTANEIAKQTEIRELKSYEDIKKNLDYDLPHQQEGALKILRDMDGRALLADEVGLGKTITAGMVLKECIKRKLVKKALILVPPSLVEQWNDELSKKFELKFNILETENDWENHDFVLASIDKVKILDKHNNIFRHGRAHQIYWDLIIIDEAHKLKKKSTQRWEFVDKLQKKRFLMLTATPFQNDLLELYNLVYLLKRGHLGTISEFKRNFLDKNNKRKPLNPRELKRKINEIMIRRTKNETNIKYNHRVAQTISVTLSDKELEIYEKIQYLLTNNYKDAEGNHINSVLTMHSILPKITSSSESAKESLTEMAHRTTLHKDTRSLAEEILRDYKLINKDSKIDILMKITKDIFSEDKNTKVLIYTKHPKTLEYLSSKLSGYKLVQFKGGLDRHKKNAIIQQFKEDAQIMISGDTGAEGLNLQFCNNLINYDLPWNPMSVEQRIGRIDRIGQTKDINIYSLATEKTMEEHVVDLIINKMCCIGLVMGELPIILFDLGLDSDKKNVEEQLMKAFLDSKNNLKIFASKVEELHQKIKKGLKEYIDIKESNTELFD